MYATLLFRIVNYFIRELYGEKNVASNSFSSRRHSKMIKLSNIADRIFSAMVVIIPNDVKESYKMIVPFRACRLVIRPFVLSEIIMVSGTWEPYVRAILDSYLTQNDVLVDVGANIGIYVIPYAKRIRKVIAFEPHPGTARLLADSIKLNNLRNVTLINKAVGETRCCVEYGLSQTPMHSGIDNPVREHKTNSFIKVDMVDLDTEISMEGQINWLLIDVEGLEISVLNGARSLLMTYQPNIIIEIFEPNVAQVISFLNGLGYTVSKLYGMYHYASKSD
jgi:FkbM family methyltransferase